MTVSLRVVLKRESGFMDLFESKLRIRPCRMNRTNLQKKHATHVLNSIPHGVVKQEEDVYKTS
jgi:hypothetical protein